jgi:2-keto-4-pentenoate hydratase/2-oxohepta-3-ene-1,7-dioic acid hydratase in catechol pathway
VLALAGLTWFLSRPAFDETLSGAPFDGMDVLPLEAGLTFARRLQDDEVKLLIVREATAEGVRAIDVGRALQRPMPDPVVALGLNGYEALEYVAREGTPQLVKWDDLTVPFDTSAHHVAAGANFLAHAEEVGIEEGPFLFPKRSQPTPWNATVADRGRLDYEAELCAVPLTRVTAERPARFGFLLCNDFTDRWPLVRDIDFDKPMGTTGFPDGKGGAGMLAVGPLFVVPRDAESFYRDLTFELYLNGQLRQRSRAGLMIWTPERIASAALEGCAQAYESEAGGVKLTDCEGIPGGTLLLTGTPEGVLFNPVTIWSPLAYLRPADEVVLRAKWLGVLVNRIE